jgi:TolA-binding protein
MRKHEHKFLSGEKMELEKPLTKTDIKYKRFARNLVATGDAVVAYKKVYPGVSTDSAKSRSKALLRLPEVQNDLRMLLNFQGLTLERLNSELLDIIENPTKEVLTRDGKKIELKDNSLRLQAIVHGHKLHGAGEKDSITLQDNRIVVFNADNIPLEKVQSRIEEIVDRLEALRNEPEIISGEVKDVVQGEDSQQTGG